MNETRLGRQTESSTDMAPSGSKSVRGTGLQRGSLLTHRQTEDNRELKSVWGYLDPGQKCSYGPPILRMSWWCYG